MADPRFFQNGFEKRLAHVVEECGEVTAAAGKTLRWGAYSFNPLLPKSEQETNLLWLRREIADLRGALDRLDEAMEIEYGPFELDTFA